MFGRSNNDTHHIGNISNSIQIAVWLFPLITISRKTYTQRCHVGFMTVNPMPFKRRYMDTYTHIHIRIHIHIHIHKHTHTHTHIHVLLHTHVHTPLIIYIYICICICIRLRIHIYNIQYSIYMNWPLIFLLYSQCHALCFIGLYLSK